MHAVIREYLAECQRQRVQPFEGLIHHIATSEVDTDLDGVPVSTIRLFAASMCRAGLHHHTTPSLARKTPRAASVPYQSNFRSLRGDRAPEEKDGTTSTVVAAADCLVSLRLRHGRRGYAQASSSRVAALSRSSAAVRPPASRGGQRAKQQQLRTRGERSGTVVSTRAPSFSGKLARGSEPITAGGHRATGFASSSGSSTETDITLPCARMQLRTLVDGVRHATQLSSTCLSNFELSGFPLATVRESAGRLCSVLPFCLRLRVLNFSGSSLTPDLLLLLTSVPHSFPTLREVSLSECDLTDACARSIQSLMLMSKEIEGAVAWRESLRSGGVSKGISSRATPSSSRSIADLEKLDLSGNALGDTTAAAIASALFHDVSLRTLDLSRNCISATGADHLLGTGAVESSALLSLDLSRNPCCSSCSPFGSKSLVSGGGSGARGGAALARPTPLDSSHALPIDLTPAVDYFFTCVQHGIEQFLLTRRDPRDVHALRTPAPIHMTSPHRGSDSPQATQLPALHGGGEPTTTVGVTAPIVVDAAATSLSAGPRAPSTCLPQETTAVAPVVEKAGLGCVCGGGATAGHAMMHVVAAHPLYLMCGLPPAVSGVAPSYGHGSFTLPQQPAQSNALVETSTQTPLQVSEKVVQTQAEGEASSQPPQEGVEEPVPQDQAAKAEEVPFDPVLSSDPLAASTATAEASTATGTASSATAVAVKRAREQYEVEQKFLAALVARVEANENDIAERLENHFQTTAGQLRGLRGELLGRLNQLVEAQREATVTASQEKAEVLEVLERAEERHARYADPEPYLAEQLVDLIQAGMSSIHRQMIEGTEAKDGGEETGTGKGDKKKGLTVTNTTSSATTSREQVSLPWDEAAKRRVFLATANERLKSLGW